LRYLLDTNVCIDFLTGRYLGVVRRIKAERPERLAVSSISVAELRYGAEKSARPLQNHQKLDKFFEELATVDFDLRAAALYGQIRQQLEQQGTPIGPYDLQIAAHALALEVILVTDNEAEFRRVPGLVVENWR
jgi:tRNA(fMet)-specific endonuclease VapC